MTTSTSQNPLASALGVILDEDNALTEQEKKRSIALTMTDEQKANVDANFARETLYDTLNKNNKVIEDLMEIARESNSARHYEVLAAMIRHNADISEKLLKIHADKQKVANNAINLERNRAQVLSGNNAMGNTNIVQIANAVFTGTTTELLELMRTANPMMVQDQSTVPTDSDE